MPYHQNYERHLYISIVFDNHIECKNWLKHEQGIQISIIPLSTQKKASMIFFLTSAVQGPSLGQVQASTCLQARVEHTLHGGQADRDDNILTLA